MNPIENQPKTASLGTRVTEQLKNDFSIEAQHQNLSNADYLQMLIENRHVVVGMMSFEGVVIELPEQNKSFLEGYAAVHSLSIEDVVAGLVDDFIRSKTVTTTLTDSSFPTQTVNGSQTTGKQAFTNVNEGVNGTVHGRLQQFSAKKEDSVNKNQLLVDAATRLIYETRIVELFNNARAVIHYAVENSGMMRNKLEKRKLWDILYKGFEADDIEYLYGESGITDIDKTGFV